MEEQPIESRNIELVKRNYELIDLGEFEGGFELLDDDIILVEADSLPYGGTHKGKDAYRRALSAILSCWKDPELKMTVFAANGDCVFAYGSSPLRAFQREKGFHSVSSRCGGFAMAVWQKSMPSMATPFSRTARLAIPSSPPER